MHSASAPNLPIRFSHAFKRLAPLGLACSVALIACNDGTAIDSSDSTDVSSLACNDALIEAAIDIRSRYPTWGDAKSGTSLSGSQYKKAHTTKELEGFGVTLVTMTGVASVQDWTEDINDPSLLFFEKDESLDRDDWPLFGFGYHHEWEDSPVMGACTRPSPDCTSSSDFAENFSIHEAGYHHNGFEIADNGDLRSGRGTVDADGCNLIDKDDLRSSISSGHGASAKHGRAWTMHVFYAPGTDLPIISTVDPWDRDGGDGWEFSVDSDAFFAQGDCCSTAPPAQLATSEGSGTSIELLDSEVNAISTPSDTDRMTFRAEDSSTGSRITMLSWRSPLEQMGLLPNDLVERVITFGSLNSSIAITDGLQFLSAFNNIQDLVPGDIFWIRIERDGARKYLAYWNL